MYIKIIFWYITLKRKKMNFKKILIALILSSLLIGCVGAASIQEFKIDAPVKEIFGSADYVIYANFHGDGGIGIYKCIDKQEDNKTVDEASLDNLIYDDGDEYITQDKDMKIIVNHDHSANFTDKLHGTHGISEVINEEGQKYVVVFWAKSSGETNMTQLKTVQDKFNEINNVTPIAF